MPCNHPFKAFDTGFLTDNGKVDYAIAFDDVESDMIDVNHVKKRIDLSKAPHRFINGNCFLTDPVSIPCGNCIGCRIDRAREWKIRNCLELAYNPECYFVTLTYDEFWLPRLDDGRCYLNKRHAQLFLKRLRRRIGPFRYFGCAEYGEKLGRSHFHFLIYGPLGKMRLIGVNKFESKEVAESWKYGQTVTELVTPGSIAYVSGYVEKKWKMDLESYPVKPFLMMSRKPGIGMAYLDDNFDDLKDDMHVYGHFHESVTSSRAPVPKAFRRKLSDLDWYKIWKDAAQAAGESMDATMKVVYKCADYARLHDLIDQAQYERLEKVRKECLL